MTSDNKNMFPDWTYPKCNTYLENKIDKLRCSINGWKYTIVNRILRFVPSADYFKAFGVRISNPNLFFICKKS